MPIHQHGFEKDPVANVHRRSLRVQAELEIYRRRERMARPIPARAGRTMPQNGTRSRHTGHPCPCTENPIWRFSRPCCIGPSLRVQGEHSNRRNRDPNHRAIPARAGRTHAQATRRAGCSGHPCACRENVVSASTVRGHVGPSLRVQGEPTASAPNVLAGRAIPARAGRTPW